ncbi:UDPGP type 1 family protein [Ruficoccus amylovorans]|uniref:UDPGP type 1 family protein n=1 Tax=Ruficoccus amylovorans TaxID=1804625 RepID=A0A842HGH1_9BACT|nr:UDPGP type 1 family protein [Ruficoccus amylovorans]MBC2594667.1 UDPGP type 1 family protein [Ruficoccus amylovorans]
MSDHAALREKFKAAGQEQVFRFWDQLSGEERESLCAQAGQIDLKEIDRLVEDLVFGQGAQGIDLSDLEPAPYTPLPSQGGDAAEWAEAKALGEKALKAGRVAAFVVAGGQGTRLGFDGPKGTYPVTPVRKHSLFQVFAEKILAASRRYGKPVPWFIMTSHINHAATVKFFEQHAYFGLDEEHVHFFQQGLMPAVDYDGKVLLEEPGKIAMSPDGHGGSLRALVRSGAVATMEKLGIDIVSYFQVDNPLIKIIDPAFIGFHLKGQSEMSSKMLPKAHAREKVGHFCVQRGKTVVVEYSDMPDELAEARDDKGQLRFLGGSIAIHILSREFIGRMGGNNPDASLPFHRADKKIAVVTAEGHQMKPDAPNGVKFEMFVFDALPFAQNPVIIETSRADDFSPVKNAEGDDSPKTSREDQLREYARWLAAAGVKVEQDGRGLPAISFEISPLFADSQDAFVEAWKKLENPPAIVEGLVIE